MAAVAVSPEQVRSLLWSDASSRVHAVVDGACIASLPALLAQSDSAGWDCLQRGALSPQAAASAAYVVELRRSSPFTDWLLFEATAALPDWGVVASSRLTLLDMREHCRALQLLRMPDGSERRWRWHDPAVLDAFLARAQPAQQDLVLQGLHRLVTPRRGGWTWYSLSQGLLQVEQRALLGKAA